MLEVYLFLIFITSSKLVQREPSKYPFKIALSHIVQKSEPYEIFKILLFFSCRIS